MFLPTPKATTRVLIREFSVVAQKVVPLFEPELLAMKFFMS